MVDPKQMEPDDIFLRIRELTDELKKNKKEDRAAEMASRIYRSGSYKEACAILNEYSI